MNLMTATRPVFSLCYVLELLAASVVGWLLATQVIMGYLDHLLAHDYSQYDWYDPFLSVINLVSTFIMVGLAIAITVQIRHPD